MVSSERCSGGERGRYQMVLCKHTDVSSGFSHRGRITDVKSSHIISNTAQ
jgi:hypothetical protein